jgi:hypothetical protein
MMPFLLEASVPGLPSRHFRVAYGLFPNPKRRPETLVSQYVAMEDGDYWIMWQLMC